MTSLKTPDPALKIFQRLYADYFGYNRIFFDVLQRERLLDNVESVLSIGAGEGDLETRLVQEYQMRLGYIEPCELLSNTFVDRVERMNLGTQVSSLHRGTFQTFASADQFDLVIAIYSWFSLGYSREMFLKACSYMKPGGRLFLSLVSQHDEYRAGFNRQQKVNAEDFSQWANENNFPHRIFYETRYVPTEGLIEKNRLTETGRAYTEFVSRTPWTKLSAEDVEHTQKSMQAAGSQGIPRVSGCLIFERRFISDE